METTKNTNTTSAWQVRCTSVNGLARYIPTTKAEADKVALEESRGCMEADITHDGGFVSAYIEGVQVIW